MGANQGQPYQIISGCGPVIVIERTDEWNDGMSTQEVLEHLCWLLQGRVWGGRFGPLGCHHPPHAAHESPQTGE